MTRFAPYVIGAVIGALLLYVLLPDPPVPEPFQVVQITTAQMDEVEPDRDRSIGERITTQVVQPSQVAIAQDSSPAAAERFVDAYVRHSVVRDSTRLHLPVIRELALLGYAGRIQDDQLELYSVGSDHTRQRHVFRAKCSPASWLYDGAEIYVQSGRWCWLDDALGLTGVGALGYGLGAQQWEFVAGGAAVLALRKLIF
ncbi:MAG: hypothetical protein ACYC28_16160 [Longimicrobiales bacterium]